MSIRFIPITEVAKRWGRSVDHIRAHIEKGNLVGMDTSTGKKREWVVRLDSVENFEAQRTVGATVEPARKKAKKKYW